MLVGDGDALIKKMIVGIDMEVGELLLVKELNREGAKIDLVMGHHPKGRALAALDQVYAVAAFSPGQYRSFEECS